MTRFLPVAALVAALLIPSAASAATVTIGSTDPTGAPDGSEASSYLTVVQTTSSPTGASYVVPAGNWIVRSVSARLYTSSMGSASVVFARPTGTPDHYVFNQGDGIELPDSQPEAVYTTTGLSRKVQGGDLLGATLLNGAVIQSNSDTAYKSARIAGPGNTGVVAGDDTEVPQGADPGAYAISATLESDTDGDGYGDDSDDKCPLDPEQFKNADECATDVSLTFSVTPTTVQGGQDVTQTTVIKNNGPSKATNLVLHYSYGQRFHHGSFPAECVDRQAETQCNLASLGVGESRTIVGKITSISPNTPPAAGSPVFEFLSVYEEGANRDLNKANNSLMNVAMTVNPIPVNTTPAKPDCFVGKLKGLSKKQAKSLLKAGHCKLGKVKKPKGKLKRGRKLVVKKQSVKAGTKAANGTKVNIKLKAVKK